MRSRKRVYRYREDILSKIKQLEAKNKAIEAKLAESEETLRAIHAGEVDAILVSTDVGEQVYTLKGAEEPYRVLFEQMNEGALTISENGNVLYSNQSFADAMRTPLEKVIGTNISNFIRPSDRAMFKVMLSKSVNEPVRTDLGLEAKDGTVVPMQLSITFLPNAKIPTYCIVAYDLTERKRAEEVLREANETLEEKVHERTRKLSESDARYRSLFENSIDAVLLTRPDGSILSANPAALHMFDMTEEEIIKAGRTGVMVGDGRWESAVHERETTGHVMTELTLIRKDGTTLEGEVTSSLFIDADGSSITSMFIRDISDRKRMEEGVKESENRLRLAQEVAKIGTFEWNIQTGKNVWTPELEEMYGIPKGSFPGTQAAWEMLVHPEDREGAVRRFNEAIDHGDFEGEWRVVWPDGSVHWIQGIGHVFRDGRGRPLRLLGVNIDVTERKRADEDLKRSNADLQQFAYVASHDLQEPLRMVTAYLGLLEKKCGNKLDGDSKKYIDFAIEGGTRARDLIRDLLEYSRVDSRSIMLSPTDMEKVLEKVLTNLKLQALDEHATITHKELPIIMADEAQLTSVLQNLISNGIKFHGVEEPKVHISFKDDPEVYTFSVQDNGIGIDPEFKDRVFIIFQRLNSRDQFEGTGIGLAIAKRIIDLHGGKIWFESEPGKGTIFYFTIPKRGEVRDRS